MLRIHFTDTDLMRIRVADTPDPLWEITSSLHRLQSRTGRWAFADWHRLARARLGEKGLEHTLRSALLPIFPKAAYLPDFLTPSLSRDGLDAGLGAIRGTAPDRIRAELALLRRVSGAPPRVMELTDTARRSELTTVIRAYHRAVIAPYTDRIQARIDAERSTLSRRLLSEGSAAVLAALGPTMRWQNPVLHVRYPAEDRDLHLNGRGLTLVPSYFCWGSPISLADSSLPPVLVYPLLHEAPNPAPEHVSPAGRRHESLSNLLGRTRATILRAAEAGSTTGELARAAGVSAPAASRHATALRDAGLITSVRRSASVLHTLTPLGAALLRTDHGFRPGSGPVPYRTG
ncbi:ArsR/SmtB family transcription factor [Streptomyces harbinensis]